MPRERSCAIYKASKYYKWQLIPKSFDRFLQEAAYLFVGTSHNDVLALTQARISTILTMKVVGSRGKGDVDREKLERKSDFYFT